MSAESNDRFNAEAAAWDTNPDVHRASDGALQAILQAFPELQKQQELGTTADRGLDVLEIGCGTGLLSFRISPYVGSLVAVDAADGMIDALSKKLSDASAPTNITPLAMMLEDPEDARLPPAANGSGETGRKKYDVVLSHLVLHHIEDVAGVLRTMHGCLKPGGRVALTDFEDFGPAARKFHPEAKMTGVERHGIPRAWLEGLLREAGFREVEVRAAWTMEKEVERWPGEWGQKKPCGKGVILETMGFPFLLGTGVR